MSEADGDAIVKQCDADNDFTDMNMLRGDMSSNPNNEDPVVPLLKCLKSCTTVLPLAGCVKVVFAVSR